MTFQTNRMRFRAWLMTHAVMAGVAVLVMPGVAGATTLESEINGLLDNHPQIRAANQSVKSAEEGVGVARSGYLPQVRLNGDVGPQRVNSSDRRTTYGQPFQRDGDTVGVTVTQRLYDGGLTDSSVDTARYGKQVSEATLRATRQATILEGVSAYIDVQRQNALVTLSRENEKRVQTQLNLEDERVKRGSGMAVDVLDAKQRLQIAKERRVAYEGALEQALAKYVQVFGHAPDVGHAVDPQPPMDLIPTSLEDATKAAQEENTGVDIAKKNVTLSGEKINTADAGYLPTVDLVGRGDYKSYKDGTNGISREWALLVQLNWELFSGFRTRSQVAQASYDYAASKDTALQADHKAVEATRQAWSQLATARERLGLLENAVNLSVEVFTARRKMREAGKATVMDVLDAESAVTNAQINYVVASYDLRVAAYQLVYAIGRLEADALDRRTATTSPAPQVK